MTLKTLNKKVALLSVGLITATALAGLANVKIGAVANSANSISNGEVKIFAQSAAGNTATTTNNDGTNTDTGISNNQTPAQAGNQGSTVNDGSAQASLQGTTPSVMSGVVFTATKWTGAAAPSQTDVDGSSASWNGTVTSVTTDSTGLADFTGLSTGFYLFKQT
ncbi:MAG: flagellar hook-length control protein FliK, partial [Streptococcaceae bacterium]|nr:flagellar hook-length control protein FliK [Streptococcaceae bacterium]